MKTRHQATRRGIVAPRGGTKARQSPKKKRGGSNCGGAAAAKESAGAAVVGRTPASSSSGSGKAAAAAGASGSSKRLRVSKRSAPNDKVGTSVASSASGKGKDGTTPEEEIKSNSPSSVLETISSANKRARKSPAKKALTNKKAPEKKNTPKKKRPAERSGATEVESKDKAVADVTTGSARKRARKAPAKKTQEKKTPAEGAIPNRKSAKDGAGTEKAAPPPPPADSAVSILPPRPLQGSPARDPSPAATSSLPMTSVGAAPLLSITPQQVQAPVPMASAVSLPGNASLAHHPPSSSPSSRTGDAFIPSSSKEEHETQTNETRPQPPPQPQPADASKLIQLFDIAMMHSPPVPATPDVVPEKTPKKAPPAPAAFAAVGAAPTSAAAAAASAVQNLPTTTTNNRSSGKNKSGGGKRGAGGAGNALANPKARAPRPRSKNFAAKLMDCLTQVHNEDAVAWLPDGKSFVVVNPDLFVTQVLPHSFGKPSKYVSFTRKLNRWNFIRLASGTGMDVFHNDLFQRGRYDLVQKLKCRDVGSGSGDGSKTAAAEEKKQPSGGGGGGGGRNSAKAAAAAGGPAPSLSGLDKFLRQRQVVAQQWLLPKPPAYTSM